MGAFDSALASVGSWAVDDGCMYLRRELMLINLMEILNAFSCCVTWFLDFFPRVCNFQVYIDSIFRSAPSLDMCTVRTLVMVDSSPPVLVPEVSSYGCSKKYCGMYSSLCKSRPDLLGAWDYDLLVQFRKDGKVKTELDIKRVVLQVPGRSQLLYYR